MKPKVSIVTTTYNSEKTIERTIKSVLSQNYNNIEYIVIDGASKDNTMKIIQKYSPQINIIISEKDDGMYTALNKGIKLASGDIVGSLNSDDVFQHENVIQKIVREFNSKPIDAVYGDMVFVNSNNMIVRNCPSMPNAEKSFRKGYCVAHMTFYAKKDLFEKYGYYIPTSEKYRLANDFELMLRFLVIKKAPYAHIPEVLVKMQEGGMGTKDWRSILKSNIECYNHAKNLNFKLSPVTLAWKLTKKYLEHKKTKYSNKIIKFLFT